MGPLLRLAFCLGLSLIGTRLVAHSLPGSSLTIWPDTDSLGLIITMPLHELELAMPTGEGLGSDPAIGAVKNEAKDRLAAYLARHLTLIDASGKRIAVSLSTARIESARNDHVGQYSLLVIEMTAAAAEFPLTLHYDAIMHEVRNHSAEIYLQAAGAGPVGIGVIRLDPTSGKATLMVIPPLP